MRDVDISFGAALQNSWVLAEASKPIRNGIKVEGRDIENRNIGRNSYPYFQTDWYLVAVIIVELYLL